MRASSSTGRRFGVGVKRRPGASDDPLTMRRTGEPGPEPSTHPLSRPAAHRRGAVPLTGRRLPPAEAAAWRPRRHGRLEHTNPAQTNGAYISG